MARADEPAVTAPRRSMCASAALAAAWIAATLIGMRVLSDYASEPGAPADPPRLWPADAGIARASGSATLLLFAHPQCPCTRATLEELARLLARCPGEVDAHVLLVVPEGARDGFADTGLADTARAIPGVHVAIDRDGVLARRFGAATSGQALLYDAQGVLAFAGGITAARGHEGDNAGATSILARLQRAPAVGPAVTPVFGCPLQGDGCGDPDEERAASPR
jgi:hypothetical protein